MNRDSQPDDGTSSQRRSPATTLPSLTRRSARHRNLFQKLVSAVAIGTLNAFAAIAAFFMPAEHYFARSTDCILSPKCMRGLEK